MGLSLGASSSVDTFEMGECDPEESAKERSILWNLYR